MISRLVIVGADHDARQAKVRHFANVVVADQDVARCQIAVDEVLRFQVAHSVGHHFGHTHQLLNQNNYFISERKKKE